MSWPPVASDFKGYFTREFIYGQGQDSVTDADITRAINEANDGSVFPMSVWDSTVQQTNAFLYLTAHLLWENIDIAGGLSAIARGRGLNGDGEGITNSKTIEQVSVNYEPPPDRIKSSPYLSRLWRSKFGMRYCQMLTPRLIGNFAIVAGPDGCNPSGYNPV